MRIIQRGIPWRWILIIGVSLLCLKLLTTVTMAYQAYNRLQELRTVIGRDAASDPEQPTAAVRAAMQSIGGLAAELRPLMGLSALFGGNGCVAAAGVEFAYKLAPYGERAAPLVKALLEMSQTITPSAIGVRNLREHWVPLTSQEADSLSALRAHPPCEGLSGQIDDIYRAFSGTVIVLDEVLRLPVNILLADEAVWLIALNNTDEVRGTGGFTTAVIVLTVTDGMLSWRLMNSYEVDNLDRLSVHPRPPRPMMQFMALPRLTFRDANWSPDHATSAEQALMLYRLDQGSATHVDGLITVNMTALPTLIASLPPLSIDGETLTPEDSLMLIREAWNTDAQALNSDATDRKDFILDLVPSLASAFSSASALELAAAGAALERIIARRDVMAYAVDPAVQQGFVTRGLAGDLATERGDFLMPVDANLGYNKVSPLVARNLHYRVDLGADPPVAEVTLTYTNRGESGVPCTVIHRNWQRVPTSDAPVPTYIDRMNGCYWVYARVFTPPTAGGLDFRADDIPVNQFIFSPDAHRATLDAWSEERAHGFGTMLVVPPGEERRFSVRYTLPGVVRLSEGRRSYHLTLQRQAGASDLTYIVEIILPQDARDVTSSPLAAMTTDALHTFSGTLAEDAFFDVAFN